MEDELREFLLNLNFLLVKYLEFLRKRMNTNPRRGPYHFRAPSKIFFRTVRGEFRMSWMQVLTIGSTELLQAWFLTKPLVVAPLWIV